MTARGAEMSQQYHKYFFNAAHLLPKGFKIKHGEAKLAFCRAPSNLTTPLGEFRLTSSTFQVKFEAALKIARNCRLLRGAEAAADLIEQSDRLTGSETMKSPLRQAPKHESNVGHSASKQKSNLGS